MHQSLRVRIPVLPVEVENPVVILNLVLVACGALCDKAVRLSSLQVIAVECDVSRKAHHQRCRKLSVFLVELEQ